MAYRFYLENYGFRDVTIILISFSSIILNSTFSKLSCMQQEFLILSSHNNFDYFLSCSFKKTSFGIQPCSSDKNWRISIITDLTHNYVHILIYIFFEILKFREQYILRKLIFWDVVVCDFSIGYLVRFFVAKYWSIFQSLKFTLKSFNFILFLTFSSLFATWPAGTTMTTARI